MPGVDPPFDSVVVEGDAVILHPYADLVSGAASFRKKPVVIQAVRLTYPVVVRTLEGDMRGEPGDYLVKGVQGELYPCKADSFAQTYEPA